MPKTLHVTTRDAWRTWLAKHGESESEIWLVFYKKHTGRPRLPYEDAIEEALCFGWIDSIVKRLDDDKYSLKFSPRRSDSKWSDVNTRRVRKLVREGRMTEAGLAKIDRATLRDRSSASRAETADDIPRFIKQALTEHPKAWKKFQTLTAARRRAYIRLITDAKKKETRDRRLQDAIALLSQGQGNPDDVPPFVKQGLGASATAWANFLELAPSHRRHYVGWIMLAKKEETRERRLREAVSLLEQNKKLGLK